MKINRARQQESVAVFGRETSLIRDVLDNLELEHALTWLLEAISQHQSGKMGGEPWHLYQTTLFAMYVDYDNGKVLTPATCLEDGTALYTCKTCSATEEGTLAKTGHTFGAWTVVTPADFGKVGEEKHVCENCDAFETREIPAVTAKLEKVSASALSDENGIGAIRLIAKLSTTADAVVTNYGIFVAKTDAIGTAKMVAYTETTESETSFALDITEIPHGELGTAIYAWAFATVDGKQIALPILVGASVNGILTEMGV